MSGLDTDPKMMRDQQNRDAPETIESDETIAAKDRSDSDEASRRERETAKLPEGAQGKDPQDANEAMDDVFNENRAARGSGRTGDEMMADAATDGSASLAQGDRSLLRR